MSSDNIDWKVWTSDYQTKISNMSTHDAWKFADEILKTSDFSKISAGELDELKKLELALVTLNDKKKLEELSDSELVGLYLFVNRTIGELLGKDQAGRRQAFNTVAAAMSLKEAIEDEAKRRGVVLPTTEPTPFFPEPGR